MPNRPLQFDGSSMQWDRRVVQFPTGRPGTCPLGTNGLGIPEAGAVGIGRPSAAYFFESGSVEYML